MDFPILQVLTTGGGAVAATAAYLFFVSLLRRRAEKGANRRALLMIYYVGFMLCVSALMVMAAILFHYVRDTEYAWLHWSPLLMAAVLLVFRAKAFEADKRVIFGRPPRTAPTAVRPREPTNRND